MRTWRCTLSVLCASVFLAAAVRGQVKPLRQRLAEDPDTALAEIRKVNRETKQKLAPALLSVFLKSDLRESDEARGLLLDIAENNQQAVVKPVVQRLKHATEENLSRYLPLFVLLRDLRPGSETVLPALLRALRQKDKRVRTEALWTIQTMGAQAEKAIPSLFQLLLVEEPTIRAQAAEALRHMPVARKHVERVRGILRQTEHDDALQFCLKVLQKMGPEASPAIPEVTELLNAEEKTTAVQAARTLETMGKAASKTVPKLIQAAEEREMDFKQIVEEVLEAVKKENKPPSVTPVSATCREGHAATIRFEATDPDNTSAALRVSVETDPRHGATLTRQAPLVMLYEAAYGYVGDDSFTWVVTDGKAESARETARVNITPDRTPPRITAISPLGHTRRVVVHFSEPVSRQTAENPRHYNVVGATRVHRVQLGSAKDAVVLHTSPLTAGIQYELTVKNITDTAKARNQVQSDKAGFFKWDNTNLRLFVRAEGDTDDDSGHEHTGDMRKGVSFAEGKQGRAFSFEGQSGDGRNAVVFANLDELKEAGHFTIAFWFKRESADTANSNHGTSNIMFSQASDGDNDNIEIGTEGSRVEIYLDTVKSDQTREYDADIQNEVWYHLALTYDADRNEEAQVFINGNCVKRWDEWEGPLDAGKASPIALGNTMHEETPFSGLIDELHVFARSLQPIEIQTLAGQL